MLLLAAYSPFSTAADCSVDGTITAQSRISLEKELAQGCRSVWLSSPGGDVQTALAMGRAMRQHMVAVHVPRDHACASACVFLYAAGVQRGAFGPILIHRPYRTSGPSSSLEHEQRMRDDLAKTIRQYLKQMNVREDLFDEMTSISPEESRALSLDEMEKFGLGFVDPVYAEWRDNHIARRAGLTRPQFILRKKQTISACGLLYDGVVPSEQMQTRIDCWHREFPEYYNQ